MSKKKNSLVEYPEVQELIARMNGGEADHLINLFIPSDDRDHQPVEEALRQQFQNSAMQLFCRLFEGATAFTGLVGIWRETNVPDPYEDRNVTMIQSLTRKNNLTERNLMELADFCRNMGDVMRQKSVGVIFNDRFVNVSIQQRDE